MATYSRGPHSAVWAVREISLSQARCPGLMDFPGFRHIPPLPPPHMNPIPGFLLVHGKWRLSTVGLIKPDSPVPDWVPNFTGQGLPGTQTCNLLLFRVGGITPHYHLICVSEWIGLQILNLVSRWKKQNGRPRHFLEVISTLSYRLALVGRRLKHIMGDTQIQF